MLDAAAGVPDSEDTRSPVQRRLDGLCEAARGYLDATSGGTAGRPHLLVHVDYATFVTGRSHGLHETDQGTVLSPEAIRRIA